MNRLFKTESSNLSDDEYRSRAELLRRRSHAFCTALLDPPPPDQLLARHFSRSPSITEHGPDWATDRLPFLGRTFTGTEACIDYFEALAATLDMASSRFRFPSPDCFIVDPEAQVGDGAAEDRGVVSVVAQATFKAARTGKTWREQCIYRLSDFDQDGRIGRWEIWADPLSAWDAVGG